MRRFVENSHVAPATAHGVQSHAMHNCRRRFRVANLFAAVFFCIAAGAGAWFWTATSEEGEAYRQELLKLKAKEGRDNALIHYILAVQNLRPYLDSVPHSTTPDIRETPGVSQAILEKAMPIRELVMWGASLRYVSDLDPGLSSRLAPHTPTFGFVTGAMRTQALCFEAAGLRPDAVRNHLASIQMLNDLSKTHLGSRLDAGKEMTLSLREIRRLAISGDLDSETLAEAFQSLVAIENDLTSFLHVIGKQTEGIEAYQAKSRRDSLEDPRALATFDAIRQYFEAHPGTNDVPPRAELEKLLRDPEVVLADKKRDDEGYLEFRRTLEDIFTTPWWNRDLGAFQLGIEAAVAKSPQFVRERPWTKWSTTGLTVRYLDPEVKHLRLRTELDATALCLALELLRRQAGGYPPTLDDVAPSFGGDIPHDPFSGEPYRYRASADGMEYCLWSIGPDMKDDDAELMAPEVQEGRVQHFWTRDVEPTYSALFGRGDLVFRTTDPAYQTGPDTYRLPGMNIEYNGGN